jgi:hypothetical protein
LGDPAPLKEKGERERGELQMETRSRILQFSVFQFVRE